MTYDERVDIIDEFGGILPYHEIFYAMFVGTHLRRADALFASFYANAIVRQKLDAILDLIDALRQAAAVSRYFFPSRNKRIHTIRAKAFRLEFGVGDSSPFADRRLRNVLEHFDERLDAYFVEDPMGRMIPWTLMDQLPDASEFDAGHLFLAASPTEQRMVVLNEFYDFGCIHDEVRRLLPLLEAVERSSRFETKRGER